MRSPWLFVTLLAAAACAQERIVVRDVQISGLHLTRRWVVERELRFSTGDSVAADDLAAARRRIQNIGVFNDVRLHSDTAGNVLVQVTEVWPLWPVLTMSFSEGQLSDVLTDPGTFFDKVAVYTGVAHLNFRGNAGQLYALLQWGAAQGFDVGYRTRWLAPRLPLALRLNFQNLRMSDRHAAVLDSTRYLRDVRYSVIAATREGAPSRIGLNAQYRAVRQEEEWPAEGNRHRTVWFTPFVILDHRDLEWYPSRGSRLEVYCDVAAGDAKFVRSGYDFRGYFPISSALRPPLLALRFWAATSSSGTPSWAHFYHGFNTGLRGYQTTQSESATFLSGELELRFPLTAETTYDVPLLGYYGRRLPWGVCGTLFVQRAQLSLDGRRTETLGFGGGFYVRVPYFQILELSIGASRDGDTEYTVGTGVSF